MAYNLNIIYTGRFPVLVFDPYPKSISYNIYRGITKDSMVKIGATSLLQYRDESKEADVMIKMDRVNYLYQVAGVDNEGKETKFTEYVNYLPEIKYPYKGIMKEIVRRNEDIVLKRIAGEPVTFYLKKAEGERSETYNDILKDIMSEKEVTNDYNQAWKGGFSKIENIYVRIRNSPLKQVESNYGVKLLNDGKELWFGTYPIVSTGDFIKTTQGRIFVIDAVTHRRYKGFLTMQKCTINELMTTHFYYNIP